VVYERLSHTKSGDTAHEIEAYVITIPPGSKSSSNDYGHPGRELGLVLAGRGELAVGTRTYKLAQGDSVSFPADAPHGLSNTGKKPLTALWVITPPKHAFYKE
jgi:quercetin dioxygenase-like cupin family protein